MHKYGHGTWQVRHDDMALVTLKSDMWHQYRLFVHNIIAKVIWKMQ